MEEARFFYYSNLAKYSLTKNYILIFFVIIEMYPMIIDFMEAPFLLRNYYYIKNTHCWENINVKPLTYIKKINLYEIFRKSINDNNRLYPISILIPMLSLIFIYIIFFIIFSILDKKRKDEKYKKINSFSLYFKIFFVNLYDHIVFRSGAIYLYDVIITYLVVSNNYFITIITIIMFSITLYLNIQYFNTFRLSIKYDLNYKYVYDGKYMFYADYFCLLFKLSICFCHNITSCSMITFFIILEFLIISTSVLKFITSNCFNLVNCSKGMFFILLLLLFTLNFVFPSIKENFNLYYIYLFITLLSSFVITFYIRYNKILKVIRAPVTPENNLLTQEKFELLCEYYQHSNFNDLLNQICFAMKIKNRDEKIPLIQNTNSINNKNGIKSMKDNNILLHLFLNFIADKFKEDSENSLLDKDVNLFYYIICKIYLELMTNQQNNFYLLFETRRILLRLKKFNLILYYDLKFFYELLCEQYSFQNNINFLICNDAFYKIYESTKKFLKGYQNFINKRYYNKTRNYIKIANLISEFDKNSKRNYDIILSTNDEYQKILLRAILESIFNQGITKDPTSILINEEFSIYEEMLDKNYNSDNHLIIKLELKTMRTEIIKIGKDLNFLWGSNISTMFPTQFIHIAKKYLYYDYQTQVQNIESQIYKFFIWDNEENIKQFIYMYKIYPKIKEDIAYLDGYYQLGNEPLLITEKDCSSNQENIILTSQSLKNVLFINQFFIETLEKFQCSLNLNSFVSKKKNIYFHLNAYSQYIYNITEKLTNMCGKEELDILNPLIIEIKNLQNKNVNNISYQFINIFSLIDEELTFQKEYKIYSIKKFKNRRTYIESNTKLKIEKENIINNNNQVISEQNISSLLNNFDANSVSSVSSRIEGLNGISGITNKRKNNLSYSKYNNNIIIIIFNLLVIMVAIFTLIYENYLNNLLLNKISFYKTVYTFNMLILNTMFGYYSLLCYVKNNGEKCVHEMKYYLNEIGFSEIYTFNQYEHYLKVSYLSDSYKILKDKVAKSNDKEIRNYLTSKKSEIHLIFENNILKNDKTSDETFDYLMGSFINKLMVTSNSEDFQTAKIYPLIVNEEFRPLMLINTQNLENLGNTQIYIYEIMISYLEYSNHFYSLQKIIEEKANNQINTNKKTLILFIFALISSNILIMGICLYFFKSFIKISNKKLQSMEILLKNEENVDNINQKLTIISILLKLYKQHPMKLFNQLSEKNKNVNIEKKRKKDKIQNQNHEEEDYEIQKIRKKKYNFSFIINPFIVILICLIVLYIIYSIIFLILSSQSFTKLLNICKIIETSSYTCLQFFLELGIIQLYQFIKIPEKALYNTLWAIYNNKTIGQGENPFVDLLNIIQDTVQKEKSLKEFEKELSHSRNIISMDCSTLFEEINDERFSTIFKEHTELNYEEILIKYCHTVPSLKYKREKYFLDDLTYAMMKLLVINYNNTNYIPNYIPSDLYSVIIKSLELYRPFKVFLGNYYFDYLDKKTNSHFLVLLGFLIGNILLEIIYFLIIKIKIIDKIETINKNLDKLLKMLKCIN